MVREVKKKYFTPTIFSESGVSLHLSIFTDYKTISFCVFNRAEDKALALVEFKFSGYDIEAELQDIFTNEQLLDFNFGTISISFSSEKFTFIPLAYFSEETAAQYLKFNHYITEQEDINYDVLHDLSIVNLYTVNGKVRQWFREKFPHSVVLNFATAFIDNIKRNYDTDVDNRAFVNVRDNDFQIAIFSYGKMIMYNHFTYNTPEEYVYYLLYALERHKINPHADTVYFIGLDMSLRNNKVGEMTSSYVRHIQTKVPFNTNKIDTALMPVLKTSSYFTLLNQHQCV